MNHHRLLADDDQADTNDANLFTRHLNCTSNAHPTMNSKIVSPQNLSATQQLPPGDCAK